MEKVEQALINKLDAFVYDDAEEVLEFFGSREEPVAEISVSVLSRFIDQELDKAKIEVLTEIFQTCYQEDSKTRELVEEKLSKLKDNK